MELGSVIIHLIRRKLIIEVIDLNLELIIKILEQLLNKMKIKPFKKETSSMKQVKQNGLVNFIPVKSWGIIDVVHFNNPIQKGMIELRYQFNLG